MKSIFNKFFARFAFGLSFVLPLVATLSCEVGLGEAVDVSAPTCTITYPPSGAIVRDSFVLAGECKDDVKVTRVAVKVVNTTTGKKVYETDADVDLIENSFSVTLNESGDSYAKTNGWQFADGTYEITAWAYDNSGKTSGVSSRSIDIDNTAPLFIISKPGVTAGSGDEASAYGSTFAVTGTIADLHEISKMALDVYDSDGRKNDFFETSIATAGGSSVEFANTTRGASSEVSPEYERYVTLYGEIDGKSDTKEFKCTVMLSDCAKIYKVPGDSGTGEGNSTSTVYLYDKVYKDLLSSAKGLGLSATNLMNISNGSAPDSRLSMKELKAKATDTADFNGGEDNRLAFTLNPAANPTYVISGLTVPVAADGSTDVSVSVANEQNLTATISAGLNNTSVSPKDICVWVKDMNSDLAEGIDPERSFTQAEAHSKFLDELAAVAERIRNDNDLVENFEENVLAAVNKKNDVWCVKNNKSSTAASGTIINVGFEMPKIIKVNHYYIVAVTAVDQDGLEVLHKQIYGFKGAGTGKLPSVVVTEPSTSLPMATSEKDNGSNKGLTFKGKTVIGDLDISRLNVSVKVTDEESGTVKGTITGTIYFNSDDRKTDTDGSIYYDWAFSPADGNGYNDATKCIAGKEYLYEATITATDKGGSTCPAVYHNIHVDTKKPEVTITGISPTVTDYDSKTNVNGKITLKANIEETNLESVKIDVYEGTNASGRKIDSLSSVIGKALSLTRELDTTEVVKNDSDAGAKAVFIVLTAVDKSGNENTYTSTQYNKDTTGKIEAIWVNQLTDKPVVEANTFYENVAYEDIKVNNNLFGLGTNNVLSGTVKDDDGIQKLVISYKKSDASAWTDDEQNLSSTSTSKTFNYSLPESAGEYEIKIYVEDTKGNAGYCTRTFETKVAVSSGAPDLNIGSQSGQFKAPDMAVTVAGTLTTDNEIKTFTCDGTSVDLPASGTNSWTNTFTTESDANSYTKTYVATDKYGQKTTKTFNYKIDTDKPVVSFNAVDLEGSKAISVTNYVIRGASNDTGLEESQSGINCIWYKVSAGKGIATPSIPVDAATEGWTQVSTTGDWNLIFDFVDYANSSEADMVTKFAEGKYTLHVFSVDNAGNKSEAKSKNFDVKLNAPVVSDLKAFEKTGTDTYGTAAVTQTRNLFKFTYKVEDSYAPARPDVDVVVKKGDTVITTGFTKDYSYPDGSVTFGLAADGTADGTYTVSVTATDNFGKKSAVVSSKIIYDTKKPEVAITAPADSSSWTNQQNIIVSGTAEDTAGGVGVETVYIADATDEPSHSETSKWTPVTVSGSQWSINKTLNTEGAGVNIWVYTKDKVGNESDSKSTTLKYDKTKPVLEGIEIKKNNEATASQFSTASTYAKNDAYDLTGTIRGDGYSPLKNVYVTCDGSNVTNTGADNKNLLTWGKTTGNESSGSWKVNASAMKDGTHEYVITVEDEAGNVSESIRKTIIVDTEKPVITKINLPDGADTKLSKFKFDGSINDGETNSSGIDSVKIKVADKTGSSEPKEYDAAGKEEWNCTVYFTGTESGNVFDTEGVKTITVTVKDKAGNENSESEDFIYDKADPFFESLASSITDKYMPLKGGTITASVKDSYKLKEAELLKITESFTPDTGSTVTTTRIYYNDNGTLKVKVNESTGTQVSAQEFKAESDSVNGNHYSALIAIPFHKVDGKPVSGKYKYVLETNDEAKNNVAAAPLEYTADLEPPSIGITAPNGNTGTNAVKVQSYTFKGTTGDTVSGVKTVYYQIVAKGGTAPSIPSDVNNPGAAWKTATLQQGSWEFSQEFKELHPEVNPVDDSGDAGKLPEGKGYKVYAFAVDNANNASAELAVKEFDVDFNSPAVNLSGTSVTSGKVFEGNVTNDKSFEVNYEIKDTHGLKSSDITVTRGTNTLVEDSGYKVVNSTTSDAMIAGKITLINPLDGDYKFEIKAKDVVGKSNESGTGTLTVKLDTTAPSIEITTPSFETKDSRLVSDWITGTNNVKVAGTTEDDGSGVLNVWIKNGASVSVPSGDVKSDTTWTAAGWTSRGKTSWTIPASDYDEGKTTINLVAVDKIGNVSAIKSADLLVDKNAPTIGKYTVSGSEKEAVKVTLDTAPSYVANRGTLLTNKSLTLEGYVEDTYELSSVTIVLTDGTTTKRYSNVSGTGINVITPVKNNGDKKWTWTLPKFMTGSTNRAHTNYLKDGTYTVTVTAVDAGGSECTYTSTISVDTTAPVLKFSSPEFDSETISANAVSWVTGTRNVKIIGTTEDNFVVSKVEYKLSSDTSWTTLTGKTNWTINAPDGGYGNGNPVVQVRATDEAGNTSAVYSRTLKIDEKAPVIRSYENGGSKYGVVVTEKDTADVVSYINDKSSLNVRRNFTLSGKVIDDWKVTGIDVEINDGSTTYSTKITEETVTKKKLTLTLSGKNTSAATWSTPEFNVKTNAEGKNNIADGIYTVTVTARDEGGQEDVQTNTIVVDTTPPEFSNVSGYVFKLGSGAYDSAKWYSGTELIVEGYYIEALTGIKSLKCALTPSGETTAKPEVEFAVTKSEANGKVYYKFKGSVANFKKGENNKLVFTAEDEAGNVSAGKELYIKMDDESPEPIARYVSIDSGKTFVNAGTITVNKKQNLTVYGTVADTDSGLSGTAEFKMGNRAVSPIAGSLMFSIEDISAEGYSKDTFAAKMADSAFQPFEAYKPEKAKTYKSWTAVIPAASLEEGALKVTFEDVAGNKGNAQVSSFQVDDKAPVVKVSTANVNINGTKDITGTVSENLTLASMELYYSTSITGSYAGGSRVDDPKTPENFGWKKFRETITDVSDIYSWTYKDFNFNTLSGAKDITSGANAGKATVYILPVVKDAAGNCNAYTSELKSGENSGKTEYYTEYVWDLDGACQKFDVDMNADRPVVQVTNLAKTGTGDSAKYILKYGTNAQISGSISDDDAESSNTVKVFLGSSRQIKSVSVSGTTYTATYNSGTPATETYAYSKAPDGTVTWTNSNEGTTTLKGTDWTYTPKDVEDGQKSVYFYVMDNNSGEFFTGNTASETLFQPYFQFKSDTKTSSAAPLTYGSDCNSPKVNYVKVGSYNSSEGKNKDPDDNTKDLIEDIGTSLYVGGKYKQYIELIVNADDANGISGIMVYGTETGTESPKNFKYMQGSIPDTETTTGYTANGNLTANGNESTWTSGKIDLSSWTTGEVSVTVNVFDNSGLKGNGSYTFNVDNTAPAISNIEPASNEQKTGKVEVKGTASDSDTGRSGLKEVTYLIPKKAQATSAATDAARAALSGWAVNKTEAMGSWVFKFNGESGAKDNPLLSSYIDDAETYVTPDAFNICDIPVWIKAVDNLGNVAIAMHTVKYNKDGDKPSTKFTYPTEESYAKDSTGTSLGYVTLGSTIRVTGTVNILNEESQAKPDGVYIQIANAKYKALKNLTVYTALKDLKLNSSQPDEKTHKSGSCLKADQLTGLTEGTDYSKKTIAADGAMTALETAWLVKGEDYSETFEFDAAAKTAAGTAGYDYTVVTADTIASQTTDENGNHKVNIAPFTVTGADGSTVDGGSGFKTAAERSAWWGIPVTNTSSSWNIAINARGELNPAEATNITNNIALRACAVNNEGKVGAWSDTYYVHIDDAAPKMTAEMRQYNVETPTADALNSAAYTAATAYETGMYLKGQWYLYLEINDESGIKAVSDGGVQFNMPTTEKYIKESNDGNNRSYKVWIPVGGIDGNLLTYKISATDTDEGNNHTITGTYQFYLDNTAPTFDKVTTTVSGDDNIIPSSGLSSYKIKDSDGQFNISSEVEESGSGFERTVFYLIRKSTGAAYAVASGTKTSILDGFSIGGTPAAPTDVKVAVENNLEAFEVKQGENTYSLYGKVYAGNQNSGKDWFSANVTANTHIRVGGLVAVDGMLRRIEEITSTGVRFSPAATGNATRANFIYAQVVDNKTAENGSVNNTQNAYGFVFRTKDGKTTDDGDGMPEKVDVTASGVTWNAYIRSSNLPDGPATLVILSFDKAGNVSCKEIDTSVANNAPRIAKVFLGTDIDGNSRYDANEFVEYNWSVNEFGQVQTDKYTDAMTLRTKDYVGGKKSVNSSGAGNGKSFIIKNGLAVVPEIVGGNIVSGGSIGMVYNRSATAATSSAGTAADPKVNDASTTYYTLPSEAKLTDSANSFYGYTLSNLEISGKTQAEFNAITKDTAATINGTGKGMSFTFWDETEEGVKGSSTQSAVLYVEDFDVDLIDVNAPSAVIHPFHWNSKSDNSIKKDANGNLLGHIELEDDLSDALKTADWGDGTAGKPVDPKISGKVVITGYAYDETRLGKITVAETTNKFTLTNCYSEYKNTDGTVAWTSASGTGWTLTVTNKSAPSQEGHLAQWTLEIDSEKVSGVACKDIKFTVTAEDATILAAKNASTPGTTQTSRGKQSDGKYYYATAEQYGLGKLYDSVAAAVAGTTVSADATTHDKIYVQGVADATNTNVYAYYRGTTGYYQMDVVPYVTGVTTALSVKSEAVPSAYSRTARGHYSVRSNEVINFMGYNLKTASYGDVDLEEVEPEDGGSIYYEFDVSNVSTSSGIAVTVNGIPSINNLNSNEACGNYSSTKTLGKTGDYDVYSNYYNRQPNNYNNNRLTDDVFLDVWQFNSEAAKPISGKVEQPIMKINPSNGQIGFAFVNGSLDWSMPKNDTSYYQWSHGFDFYSSIGMSFDEDGNAYGCAVGGDINDHAADHFNFYTSLRGPAKGTSQDEGWNGSACARISSVGTLSRELLVKTNRTDGKVEDVNYPFEFNKQRFKSPSIATAKQSNGSKNVYFAYYDDMLGEVRFLVGNTNKANDQTVSLPANYYIKWFDVDNWTYNANYGKDGTKVPFQFAHPYAGAEWNDISNGDKVNLYDSDGKLIASNKEVFGKGDSYLCVKDVTFTEEESKTNGTRGVKVSRGVPQKCAYFRKIVNGSEVATKTVTKKVAANNVFWDFDTDHDVKAYKHENVQLLAGNYHGISSNPNKPGEFVAIDVIHKSGINSGNDVVVCIWYDQTNNKLMYMYNTNPGNGWEGDTTAKNWSKAIPVFRGKTFVNAGEYCQIAVDKEGGIHIAGYDVVSSSLVYAYASSYNGTFTSCVVDKNAGDRLTLDVAYDNATAGGKPVPYIGYYSTACTSAKVAYKIASSVETGCDSEKYTGEWECSVVPSPKQLENTSAQYNRINVGVWKNAGVITSSVHTADATNNYYSGTVYGNGTANPVLGYAVKINSSNSYIETAQMR